MIDIGFCTDTNQYSWHFNIRSQNNSKFTPKNILPRFIHVCRQACQALTSASTNLGSFRLQIQQVFRFNLTYSEYKNTTKYNKIQQATCSNLENQWESQLLQFLPSWLHFSRLASTVILGMGPKQEDVATGLTQHTTSVCANIGAMQATVRMPCGTVLTKTIICKLYANIKLYNLCEYSRFRTNTRTVLAGIQEHHKWHLQRADLRLWIVWRFASCQSCPLLKAKRQSPEVY